MRPVVIVDYGLCNLDSIARALEECGGDVTVTRDPAVVAGAERIVLPGVGAFAEAMTNLRDWGLDAAMTDKVAQGAPMLGVCLGMQLLAATGTEGGDRPGLGLIEGTVERLVPNGAGERVPHVGWNELARRGDSPLLDGIEPERDFYFVHSYHLRCADDADVVATTPHCGGFASVVARGNVFGAQFHPEKSQKAGFALLRNFLAL